MVFIPVQDDNALRNIRFQWVTLGLIAANLWGLRQSRDWRNLRLREKFLGEKPIEMRPVAEVQGYSTAMWCTPDTPAYNPAFDITPGTLVTKFILEKGVFASTELTRVRGPGM